MLLALLVGIVRERTIVDRISQPYQDLPLLEQDQPIIQFPPRRPMDRKGCHPALAPQNIELSSAADHDQKLKLLYGTTLAVHGVP